MLFAKDSFMGTIEEEQSLRKLVDYNVYIMSKKERLLYALLAAVAIFTVGYIFYRSIILSALLCPLAILYPKYRTKELIAKRKSDLNLQFKDMLYSLSSSLSAGKAPESAMKDVQRDLAIQYPDPNTYILKEVEYIIRRIEMNETIEAAFENFAKRSHLEDIQSFADVFNSCKRSGGNIVEIIRNTSNIINDKIEIKQEIETLLSQKKFEQKILNIMPLAMIIILSVSAKDYMEPVFTTVAGRAVMTVSMLLLALAFFISNKIMDINI